MNENDLLVETATRQHIFTRLLGMSLPVEERKAHNKDGILVSELVRSYVVTGVCSLESIFHTICRMTCYAKLDDACARITHPHPACILG